MKHGEAFASVFSSPQMQHALHEAVWAARVLLHVDASIIFFCNTEEHLTVAAWHGREAGDVIISAHSPYVKALRAGQRSIMWDRRDRCADQDLGTILDKMGLHGGLVVPLLVNSSLMGMWLVATCTERTFGEADELVLHTLAENISLVTESVLLSAENLRYRREAHALYEISMELSHLMDLDQVLRVIAEKTCNLLNAEISYIALADDEAQAIRVRVTHGTRGDALGRMVLKYGEGVGGFVAATRTPLLLDNYPADPRPKPPGIAQIVATEGIVSVICVPMFTRRGLIGVLYAASRQEATFNHSQLDLLRALGTQAAIAIENARLYEEEKVAAEKLRASMTTHQQLLSLVLGNQGLQAIADTLSDLVRCPIIVEDDRFRILCWSIRGCAGLDEKQMQALHHISSADIWQDPDLRDHLKVLRDARHHIRVPPRPMGRVYFSRIVAPIVAGMTLLGYVSAVETGQALDEQQRSAVEQASIIFALEFLKQEAARAVEERLAGDFLDDLLFGRGAIDPAVSQRAARFGVDLNRPHRILVLEIDEFAQAIRKHHWTDVETLTIKRQFLGTVSDVLRRDVPGALLSTRGDSVVILVPERSSLSDVITLACTIQQSLGSSMPELTISAGIGRIAEDATQLSRSYRDALMALCSVQRVCGKGRVVAFENLGVLPLLLQSEDQQGLVAFMERYLGPLLDYDARHHTEFVSTLAAFLAHNGNLQRTAANCHLHLNSLKYRMRRIREISGLDLDNSETRFNLHLALSIRAALSILNDGLVKYLVPGGELAEAA